MQGKRLKVWLPAVRVGTGTDVFTDRLAAGLRRAGHEAVVQWFHGRNEFAPWRLRGVAAPAGTDIVHAGSWQGFAFKREGIPLVVTEHHYISHPQFRPLRSALQAIYHDAWVSRFVRRSYACADALTAVSETTAQAMRQDGATNVDVVGNWLAMSQWPPAQARARTRDEPFVLLFVGNPSRRKGSDLLPEIARRLGAGFEVRVLGGLRAAAGAHGGIANMVSLPPVSPSEMASIYAACDAVLVPARYEAFGFVALEAMASARPVVGFDGSGTSEICVHGVTAMLAPVDDLQALVRNITTLAADPGLAIRLGHAGRARAVAQFGEAAAMVRYLDIYRRVLALSA